jgi:uncharacterized protein (TIGR03437 family)
MPRLRSRQPGRLQVKPAVVLFACAGALFAGSGQSGAPGDSTCAACHGASTTPLFSQPGGNGVFMTFSGGTTYTPGITQDVTIALTDPAFHAYGYQTSARIQGQEISAGAGALIAVDPDTQLYAPASPGAPGWIGAGESPTGTTDNPFHFRWTPPASGTVVFYVIGMGGNGSGGPQPEEHVYANSYTLTPAAAPIAKPAISPGGVMSAAANVPGLAPGAWVAIYGENLSPNKRTWTGSDFIGNALPMSLDGVSVTIDNKSAAVYFISPAQLNVQVPDDTTQGPVEVIVTTPAGAGPPVIANMDTVAPSFFTLDGKYVTAPAKPGEVIAIYGTGFGPTSPPTPAGVIVSAPNPLQAMGALRISIGGIPAQVAFAGETGAGLWQLNVTVPAALPDGDAAIVAGVGNAHTQDGAYIPIHH